MKRSTTRLGRVLLILMASSYVLQSGNLFLDQGLIYVDQQQQLQLHQQHDHGWHLAKSTSSSSSSKPLTWFLHFHKAAGSSFCDMAIRNSEVFRDAKDKHGHLELSRQGAFRWELLGGGESSSSTKLNRTTCWLDHSDDDRNRMERDQARVLGKEMKSLREQGVSFVSTEHWFPSQWVLKELQEPAPVMVVLLREPVERVLSSYAYHNRGGGRCSGIAPGTVDKKKKRCDLDDWHNGEGNMYVSMLNGIPFGPRKVGAACAPHMLDINAHDYQRAKQSLDQNFQVVLTLDSFRQRPSQVACVLNKALGWNETTLPQKNRNSKQRATDSIDPQVLQQVKDTNAYDIQLYQHAQELESRLFAQLGCNAVDEAVKSRER